MFSIKETTAWSAEDVIARIQAVTPAGWKFSMVLEEGWYKAALTNQDVHQWGGEHPDPKYLCLEALGWLSVQNRQVQNPAWRPRDQEVALHRPSGTLISPVPEPADLDPAEVASVYNTPTR